MNIQFGQNLTLQQSFAINFIQYKLNWKGLEIANLEQNEWLRVIWAHQTAILVICMILLFCVSNRIYIVSSLTLLKPLSLVIIVKPNHLLRQMTNDLRSKNNSSSKIKLLFGETNSFQFSFSLRKLNLWFQSFIY